MKGTFRRQKGKSQCISVVCGIIKDTANVERLDKIPKLNRPVMNCKLIYRQGLNVEIILNDSQRAFRDCGLWKGLRQKGLEGFCGINHDGFVAKQATKDLRTKSPRTRTFGKLVHVSCILLGHFEDFLQYLPRWLATCLSNNNNGPHQCGDISSH